MSEPIYTLTASQPRRYLATAMLVALGALLIWIAFARPPGAFGWQLYLLGVGVVMLFAATRLWSASARQLTLTAEGLFEEGGRRICALDNVVEVERSFFAFKPSNGFLIRLKTSEGRAWAPGLWWRIGRRVGVGGVTSASHARVMAELMAMQLHGGPTFPPDGDQG